MTSLWLSEGEEFTIADKAKLDGLTAGFQGYFATPSALTTAIPVGVVGDHAVVGSTDTIWLWDDGTVSWLDSGIQGGDMLRITYDPTNVAGDAFSMGNMVETATAKVLTNVERTNIAFINQDVKTTASPSFAALTVDNMNLNGNTLDVTGDYIIDLTGLGGTTTHSIVSSTFNFYEIRHKSTEGVRMVLEADTDNVDEEDVARILFISDGGVRTNIIGTNMSSTQGPDGETVGEADVNDFMLHSVEGSVQLAAVNQVFFQVADGFNRVIGADAFESGGELRFGDNFAVRFTEDIDDSLRLNVDDRFAIDTGDGVRITNGGSLTPSAMLDVDGDGLFSLRITAESREVEMTGDNYVNVYALTDLPAPSAGVRALVGSEYRQMVSLSTSDRFTLPNATTTNYRGNAFNITNLTYTGTATLFTASSVGFFHIFDLTIIGNSSATLFDITAGTLPATQVTFTRSRADNFGSLGTLTDVGVEISSSIFLNNGGLTLDNVPEFSIDEVRTFNLSDLGSTAFTIKGPSDVRGKISGVNITTFAGENFLDIRPDIGDDASILIEGNSFKGTGGVSSFFKASSTGTITAVADASGSKFTNAVADAGGGLSRFTTSVAHGFFTNQEVVHINHTEPTYNNTFIITVFSTTQYDVKVAFVATDSGITNSDSVTISSTAHGLAEGAGVLIVDPLDYIGGATIYNSLTNSFQINRTFVATGTGSWDDASLNKTEPRIISTGNSVIEDSFTIGSFTVTTNTTLTDFSGVTVGDFIDMKFDSVGAVLGTNAELFKMVNVNNGELQYIGKTTLKGTLVAAVASIKTGSSVVYHIRAVVDGVDGAPIEFEVRSTVVTTPFVKDIVINPGERFKLQAANQSNTDNITFSFLNSSLN